VRQNRNNDSKRPTGLDVRHARNCRNSEGDPCNCVPSVRAWVFDRRTKTKIRKTFAGKGALAAAKRWRHDASSQQNAGKPIGPSKLTLRQAADAWLAGAEADPPTVLTRGGSPFKPVVIREYRRTLNQYVLDDYGAVRLSDIRPATFKVSSTG